MCKNVQNLQFVNIKNPRIHGHYRDCSERNDPFLFVYSPLPLTGSMYKKMYLHVDIMNSDKGSDQGTLKLLWRIGYECI